MRYEKNTDYFSNTVMVLFQVEIMIMKTQEKINWANRMEDISMPSSAFFVKLNRPILLEDSLQIDHSKIIT